MKRNSFLFILFSFSFASYSQNADSTWIVNNYIKMEKSIAMRDGIKLFTSIYIPKDKTDRHPILISRTPYSSAPYGENNFRDFWNSYENEYFKEGYIA